MFRTLAIIKLCLLSAFSFAAVSISGINKSHASAEKICRLNDFASEKCGEEPGWVQYCSIRVLCFEASSKEDGLVTAKHQDGRIVKYKVTGWEEGIDWRNQRFSLLTFVRADGSSEKIGKLWLRYDPGTQQNIESLMAYTPDGFDFQGVRAVNE